LARPRLKTGEETDRSRTDAFAKGLYTRETDFQTADRVTSIAAAHGVPNAQIALAWMLSKPEISAPIIGATKINQLEDAVASISVHLSEDEIRQLEEGYQPHPVLGFS
jgi:aryl-alcohol dehydrogenase-like predicted oxidoreductase